jgi:hypothetical protein
MKTAKKGDYVQIKLVVLDADARKPGLPEDTAKTPYLALVMGFLEDGEASVGDPVTIRTPADRRMEGELYAVNPPLGSTFGSPVPELLHIGAELRALLAQIDGEA